MPSPPSVFTPMPFSQAGFNCHLPFLRQVDAGHWQAGFLRLPSGTFSADVNAPPLAGYYDRAVSRWLPVGRNAVAPDGLHYALITGGGPSQTSVPPVLHIVSAATGVERMIDLGLPGGQPYGVENYATDEIYVGSGWEGTVFGYWRVDQASGRVVALGRSGLLLDDGTGHAWRTVVDPRDPKPAQSAISGDPLPDKIVRRDLKTGAEETWFYHPGFSLAIVGTFVGGSLLVLAEPDTSSPIDFREYWLIGGPARSVFIAYLLRGAQSIADSYGIWMGSSDGLYLFTPDGGIRRVAGVPGDPENGCL